MENESQTRNRPTLEEYLIPYAGVTMYSLRMIREGIATDGRYIPKLILSHSAIILGIVGIAAGLEMLLK